MNAACDILVIGGSAGSLGVVLELLPNFNGPFTIPIVIVMHRRDADDNTLTEVLSHYAKWPVKEAEDKETIQPGIIYVAPADYHLLIEKDHTFSLDNSEKVNFSRPSIDVTFEAAAEAYGRTTVGLLLSGANADGVAGLKAIRRARGGIVIQDPTSALVPDMPRQALQTLEADVLLDPAEMEGFVRYLENRGE